VKQRRSARTVWEHRQTRPRTKLFIGSMIFGATGGCGELLRRESRVPQPRLGRRGDLGQFVVGNYQPAEFHDAFEGFERLREKMFEVDNNTPARAARRRAGARCNLAITSSQACETSAARPQRVHYFERMPDANDDPRRRLQPKPDGINRLARGVFPTPRRRTREGSVDFLSRARAARKHCRPASGKSRHVIQPPPRLFSRRRSPR